MLSNFSFSFVMHTSAYANCLFVAASVPSASILDIAMNAKLSRAIATLAITMLLVILFAKYPIDSAVVAFNFLSLLNAPLKCSF